MRDAADTFRTIRDLTPPALVLLFPVAAVVAPEGLVGLLVLAGLCGAARVGDRTVLLSVLAAIAAGVAAWALLGVLPAADGPSRPAPWLRLTLLTLCAAAALATFRDTPRESARRLHDALIGGLAVAFLSWWIAGALGSTAEGDYPGAAVIAVAVWPAVGVLLLRGRKLSAALLALCALGSFAVLPRAMDPALLATGIAGLAWGLLPRGTGWRIAAPVIAVALFAVAAIAVPDFADWPGWWIAAFFLIGATAASVRRRAAGRTARLPIRVLVNGLHSRTGGGITYLRNVVPLLAGEPDLELHLCLRDDQRNFAFDPAVDVTVHRIASRQRIWQLPLGEQITVPLLADRIGADVTFSPANYGPILAPAPVILLGNVLGVGMVERRPRMIAYWFLLYVATALSLLTSRAAIAISEYAWKSMTRAGLGFLGKRVTVIPHGVGPAFAPPPVAEERGDFLLAVSDVYVQKNYENLIAALARLHRAHPDLSLKIAGRLVDAEYADRILRAVAAAGLHGRVELLGTVDQDRLAGLYRSCAVFVFPSRVESFGIPLVEAMASGAAIASSDAAAMPEVLGDAGLYFDPDDIDDMAAKIDTLLRDSALRRRLGASAVARARTYSWQRTASQTAAVIRRAARAPLQS